MLSKNLENSTSYDIFFNKFWKKARVYYTLSISRYGMVWYGNILFDIVHNIIENVLPKHKNM